VFGIGNISDRESWGVALAQSFPVIATRSLGWVLAAWVAADAKRIVWVIRAEKAATWTSTAAKAIFLSMRQNALRRPRFLRLQVFRLLTGTSDR
jgi:hypothetical protein